MSSEEIIDPTKQSDFSVRRILFHLVLPGLALVLSVLAIVVIGMHSYNTTRTGVRTLTHELLDAVQRYISQEVSDYIMPASAGNIVASGMIEHVPVAVQKRVFFSYGSAMLHNIPQIESFYLADARGNFTMIARTKDRKNIEQTTLEGTQGHKVFHHIYYNNDGVQLGEASDPAGEYDPRLRPWYKVTEHKDAVQWTQPYLFPSSGQFIMTSALRFKGIDSQTVVFATNISLNELSGFLDRMKVGKTGNAIILDTEGRVIAGRHLMKLAKEADWDPAKMVLNAKTSPILAMGFDHYRVRGFGPRSFTVDGKPYVTMTSPLKNSSESWVLLLSAPESDFSNFARQSSKQSLQFAAVIIVFSLILAGLLARQVRRTDRTDRLLVAQQRQVAREAASVQQISSTPHLFDDPSEPLVLTEQLADITGARRVSVWRFLHDGSAMICEDSYDSKQDTHSGGFEMFRQDMEEFFKALEDGENFSVDDATGDTRTTQFERLVMREIGTERVVVHPARGAGEVVGAVVLEDASSVGHLLYFVDLISSIVAVRFASLYGDRTTGFNDADSGKIIAGDNDVPQVVSGLKPHFDTVLNADSKAALAETSGVYHHVAVLVVVFTDPVLHNDTETVELLQLIDRLACEVQRIATEQQLFAVKIAGHRMICTAGCTDTEDPTALLRIANAALSMREAFMAALAGANLEPVFTMGLDYGAAFGREVGHEPKVFNLWGQTVSVAELMAQGAAGAGTVQVTERVYTVLRDRYLFRSRGTFFAPHLGLSRAYILAAHR
ncbi:adenylate/guanylate cyclase domain-containing protein [Acetobacter thailandicus]|uniref:adenylate/guanylate cyclase domain-containing protein n=1 Tax=Acetobacter thailandicus TaxID=1502842 RepID=UPI001BAB4B47|nr:GAF domain-containing protein [Acetobacter thailandicus]